MEDRGHGGYDNPNMAWKAARDYAKQPYEIGVPEGVLTACWETAQKVVLKGQKGKWTSRGAGMTKKVEEEYERRVREYRAKRHLREEQAEKRAADRAAMAEAAKAAKLEVKEEVKETQPADFYQEEDEQVEYESWEDRLPLSAATDKAKLVPKQATVTFDDAPTEFVVPHGHKILAASRSYGDRALRMKGLGYTLANLKKGFKTPAIIDLGAGASGVKHAVDVMTSIKDADRVYHHCCMPLACSTDLARYSTLAKALVHIHWISEDDKPVLGKVNVCQHKASECDCLRHYDYRYVMAVHSHYYFDVNDWHNLFRYTDRVATYSHVPSRLNVAVPVAEPEFKWVKQREATTLTWYQKLHARMREYVIGVDEMLAFEPLLTHGTTYYQRDPRVDLDHGGFHMPVAAGRLADRLANDTTALTAMALAHASGVASLLVQGVPAMLSRDFGRLFTVATRAAVLCAPCELVRYSHRLKYISTPSMAAVYTVKIINGKSVVHKGEELAHFYTYLRSPVCTLEPRTTKSYRPDMKTAREIAATMAISKKPPDEVMNIAKAKCLREDVPLAKVADTLKEAKEIVELTDPKNVESPQPLRLWSRVTSDPACALVGAAVAAQAAVIVCSSISVPPWFYNIPGDPVVATRLSTLISNWYEHLPRLYSPRMRSYDWRAIVEVLNKDNPLERVSLDSLQAMGSPSPRVSPMLTVPLSLGT